MQSKIIKRIVDAAMAAIILMMMTATVVEKYQGTGTAFEWFYHSPAFFALWAIAAVSGLLLLIKYGVPRRPIIFALHLSFLLILAGACTTHFFGSQGNMHLRTGESADFFYGNKGPEKLPFTLTLDDFNVDYYPGTSSPMDYRSLVSVEGTQSTISMNNILKCRGYRFYQSGYDSDGMGSTLSVSHDPIGTGLTYTGYYLLFACLVAFFFCKESTFRKVLARYRNSLSALAAVISIGFASAPSASAASAPQTAPDRIVSALEDIYVYHNGRVTTLGTLDRDYVNKVYGRQNVHGFTKGQVFAGWLWYFDSWSDVPMKVKARDRGTVREEEKSYAMRSVSSAEALKIFPISDDSGKINWYSPADKIPMDMAEDEWIFMKRIMGMVGEDLFNKDYEDAAMLLGKIRDYQIKKAADVLPSAARVKAEGIYNTIDIPKPIAMAIMTLGIILFIVCSLAVARGHRTEPRLQFIVFVLNMVLTAWLTAILGLRWFASGHLPMVSGFEMMMLIAWAASIITALLWQKIPIIQPLGIMLMGFALLVASMGESNPQITPLMPVLGSPLLSLHVASMMISYTLFGMAALNGLFGLILGRNEASRQIADMGLLVIYPAVFMLAAGTFIGAIWANVSWGSYWAWDPKETWALITLLIYALGLHSASNKFLQNPKVFNWFCVLAFLSVLITYFGVNFILGGMHSYA